MTRVVVSPEARSDLLRIGAPRPSLGERVRIAIVHPYIVLYEYLHGSDLVQLLRVVHGRRKITKDLLGP